MRIIAELHHGHWSVWFDSADIPARVAGVQEAILFLEPVAKGRDPITEGDLRPIVAIADWKTQRRTSPT